MPRRDKTDEELIDALKRHVRLLQEYHQRAFEGSESDYYGEVAGKIRLLIYRSRTCHPLLLDLMQKYQIEVRLNLIGPGNRSANVEEFFENVSGAFRSQRTGDLIEVTRIKIVRSWAQQIGSSHEDPSIEEDFDELLSQDFFVNNRQIAVDELRRSSHFVLHVAKFFFDDYEKIKGNESEA